LPRYAVLLDLEDPELLPIALVTEHEHEVLVHFAVECGLKSRFREPYDVLEPDGETVRFEPGRPEYFNSVINTLSRSFAVAELDERESLDPHDIASLYFEKVALARTPKQAAYAYAGTNYVVASYAAGVPDDEVEVVADDASALARAA